jgi:hypothetical protein
MGIISWAPIMTCVDGTVSNYDDGVKETGEACTPKENRNRDVISTFSPVNTGEAGCAS